MGYYRAALRGVCDETNQQSGFCVNVTDAQGTSGSIPLEERLRRMRHGAPVAGATYHCVTLLGNEEGKVVPSCQSRCVGIAETTPRREIREATPVIPEKMLSLLESIGEPGMLVNDAADLYLYLLLGGHGAMRLPTKSLKR